jgi:hypothetical protein
MNPNIFCFSGCKDNQTSADSFSTKLNESVGAFTQTFIDTITEANMDIDIMTLYSKVCVNIAAAGFSQQPAFSCSSITPSYHFSKVAATPTQNVNLIGDKLIVTNAKKEVENDTSANVSENPSKPDVKMQLSTPPPQVVNPSQPVSITSQLSMPLMASRHKPPTKMGNMFSRL